MVMIGMFSVIGIFSIWEEGAADEGTLSASGARGIILARLFLTRRIFVLSEVGMSRRLSVRMGVCVILGFLTALFLSRGVVGSSKMVLVAPEVGGIGRFFSGFAGKEFFEVFPFDRGWFDKGYYNQKTC